MKNRQTIFKKYLYISMFVTLIGFTILGVMIVFFIMQNWQNDRWDGMKSNAATISLSIADNALISDGKLKFSQKSSEVIQATMQTFSGGISDDIIVADSNGNILFYSENAAGIDKNTAISGDFVKQAMDGGVCEISQLGGIYGSKYYIVGVPVLMFQNQKTFSVGAVFVTSSATHYYEYITTIIKIFCSAGIVTFALIFCFVGIFSYKLTKPLQQMAKAAKAFGNGDFSIRVNVKSKDEVGELARAFNSMADKLAASEGMRRAFVANVSHELKTPMTTIAGFIDGILDGTIPTAREKYYLNIVTVEIKRLSRLVTSMLALSRIDSGELKMASQSFDISSTVLNTFLTFEQKIESKKINVVGLEDNKPLYIEGDPDMIHQVVYNLVENASKFTNEGGNITVSVEDDGHDAIVTITNTGEGIPKDQIGFIFDRFYKTDKSRSHDKNGMGLGLYLVKTIIQLHNGEITAESVEGESTTFKFRLPKKKEIPKKLASLIVSSKKGGSYEEKSSAVNK